MKYILKEKETEQREGNRAKKNNQKSGQCPKAKK